MPHRNKCKLVLFLNLDPIFGSMKNVTEAMRIVHIVEKRVLTFLPNAGVAKVIMIVEALKWSDQGRVICITTYSTTPRSRKTKLTELSIGQLRRSLMFIHGSVISMKFREFVG